ncbi:acyl carrier protein [Rhodococcus sp. NPDC058514]|uniref:acyl carrier protein n=1 Tax=unclassified Rhodococcus (in: high G+C Gram-positive bacteria) TaxID=192944 RepID=UPI00365C7AEC
MNAIAEQHFAIEIADLVAAATEGTISAELARSGGTFAEHGMTSLSFLRLIDSIEIKYGVEVDLETELDSMTTVSAIAAYLGERNVAPLV